MERQLELLEAPPGTTATPRRTRRAGLRVRQWNGWLPDPDRAFRALLTQVSWKQESITFHGRTHPLPRLTCWVGDPGCHYTYSGVHNRIEPWIPLLADLRGRVEKEAGCRFNSLLLTLYRDGRDRLAWHADDEPELDPHAPIASLSLGATRTFRFRPRTTSAAAAPPVRFELAAGDLLVMDPPTQRHWLHQVPARLRVSAPRINLTFRVIRPRGLLMPPRGVRRDRA
ncbi:MAG: alpha-ketoglutarate-dependent dioxygenase AlkB [Synechococcaceae cyanobacterium]|nr:alpha-ketoglutarate-dependent dioxygenase AlkB [Synechococcaceae cyanobacterium]